MATATVETPRTPLEPLQAQQAKLVARCADAGAAAQTEEASITPAWKSCVLTRRTGAARSIRTILKTALTEGVSSAAFSPASLRSRR